MSYDDDTLAARGAGPDAQAAVQATVQANKPATPEADPALAELRRALLIYGTAGQAARMEARAS